MGALHQMHVLRDVLANPGTQPIGAGSGRSIVEMDGHFFNAKSSDLRQRIGIQEQIMLTLEPTSGVRSSYRDAEWVQERDRQYGFK